MGERYGEMLEHRVQGTDYLALTDFSHGNGLMGYAFPTLTTLTDAISSTQHRHMGLNIPTDLIHLFTFFL